MGEKTPIDMAVTERLTPERGGFLGTDLSGSHPVSFYVNRQSAEENGPTDRDMAVTSAEIIALDPDVKLDASGKMQCTTCHDPHIDDNFQEGKVPRFWVKKSTDEVCLVCHIVR